MVLAKGAGAGTATGNIWVVVHLLDLDAALTVVLMATGLEIAKLGIGRTSVIDVEREVI